MRKLLAVLLLSACAYADQRVVELRNINFNNLDGFVAPFGVNLKLSPNPRFVALSGTKEQLDAAEAAIRKIDVPARNVELTFQILLASTKSEPDRVPADVEPVVKQLKKTFLFQSFTIADTIELRAREARRAEASSAAASPEGQSPARFSVVATPYVAEDAKGLLVRLDDFRFNARSFLTGDPLGKIGPPSNGTGSGGGIGSGKGGGVGSGNGIGYGPGGNSEVDTGFNQSVDVREGQKVVVGRASLSGRDTAFFLVVTAKVVD